MSDKVTICYETDISQFAPIAVPTGSVLPFSGAVAPDSYLLCDGAEVSKETYAALFAVIGDTFGAASEETVFKLPDMRGRVPVGAGQGDDLSDRVIGATDGKETHQLTVEEMPRHEHAWENSFYSLVRVSASGSESVGSGSEDYSNLRSTGSFQGGDQPHNNMQPYLVVNYIIKV